MYFYKKIKKMAFALIILGLIIGGILAIICLVFAIIGLANNQKQKAIGWSVGFLISLIIVIFSVFKMVHRVSEGVQTGIDWVKEHKDDITINEDTQFRKTERQEWLDTLQAHLLDKYENNVPVDFYINKPAVKDSSGLIKVPFLYPYLIRYNDITSTGDIIIEGEDSVFVENVSQIAFDENFAIIKADNSQSPELLKAGRPETEYLLYDMRTRNFENAPNNEKLLNLADRIGYTGPIQMQYLSDVYRGWIVYTDYD
jgi:hypothetical protein